MHTFYRKVHFKYKLILMLSVALISTLIGWRVGEPYIVGGSATLLAVFLHLYLSYKGSLMTVTVLAVYTFGSVVFAISILAYGTEVLELLQINTALMLTLYASTQIVCIATYLYLTYRYCKGHMWFNLAVAFLIQTIASSVVIAIAPSFYVLALFAGYVAGGGYLLLRFVRTSKKPSVMQMPVLADARRKTTKLLKRSDFDFKEVNPSSAFPGVQYLCVTRSSLFAITVVSPKRKFVLNDFGFFNDGVNQIPLFELIHSTINDHSKEFRNVVKNIIHVAVVVADDIPERFPSNTTMRITRWKQPSHALGNTVLCTPEGLLRLLHASEGEQKKLSPQIISELNKFDGFYTYEVDAETTQTTSSAITTT